MHDMYPDIYKDDICKLCNKEKETVVHLTTCEFFDEKWALVKQTMVEYVVGFLGKKLDIKVDHRIVVELFNHKNEKGENIDYWNWISGFIPPYQFDRIKSWTKSNNKARLLTNKITDKMQKIFRDDIWNFRCYHLKELGLIYQQLKNESKKGGKQKVSNREVRIEKQKESIDEIICYDDLSINGDYEEKISLNIDRSAETGEIRLKNIDKKDWTVNILYKKLCKWVFGEFFNGGFFINKSLDKYKKFGKNQGNYSKNIDNTKNNSLTCSR
jgi:hypothetical protein